MKKRALSLLLASLMLAGTLAGCKPNNQDETESKTENPTESQSTVPPETESSSQSETDSEAETEPIVELTGPYADVIQNAYNLANGVNAYFPTADRESFRIENQNMVLDYALPIDQKQQVNYIHNTRGQAYIENTMDVFVTMKNGATYYASQSQEPARPNLDRMGFYMYEMRVDDQVFFADITAADYKILPTNPRRSNDIKTKYLEDGAIFCQIAGETDPNISFPEATYSADQYNYLQITLKANVAATRSVDIYLIAGDHKSFSNEQVLRFYIAASEDYVTYNVPLDSIPDYKGEVTGFRLDINGKKTEDVTIKEIKVINAGESTPPQLSLSRSFYAYTDKLHHRIQIAAAAEANDIAEVGMITRVTAEKVTKLIVKDKNGEHESLDGIDWASAEYIGFDIKDAGIFGYILPVHSTSGQMTVTLDNGSYVILQTRAPENNTIKPSLKNTENANDFYMGQRIYTDETHDFTGFLKEAYCERNPLKGITVEAGTANGSYVGYDALRGFYELKMDGSNFNLALKAEPNRHFNVGISVKGDKLDRNIYMFATTESGALECAVLMNDKDMILPIPLEVGKNFLGDESSTIFNLEDTQFSDTIFPLSVKAGDKKEYTLVNLYQNWGNYPLKQISWIQFHCPYYHLSTGVTETNCIVPWYTTRGGRNISAVLPDHRAMSAPYWSGQPQHTSGGDHSFLEYTDAEGNYNATESTRNTIDSYGPTYADLKMDYITDDGKIKATYIHTEMPQTDENRAYYEMTYEVLEDLTIADFKNDFAFYSVEPNDPNGHYRQFGYLNEENQPTVVKTSASKEANYYVLGDECPYFDYFDMTGNTSSQLGYVNLSFLIYNAEFIINGEKTDVRFIVKEAHNKAILSLDLGKVTLRKGDKFTINAIIMPWGSHESDYSGAAPDKNVRDVRENSLLNPFKLQADADCKILDSTFVPKIKTTNGKTAEFTLSGGHNNVAIRVYGFDLLTAPKIYEKIDGKWVEYVISSSKTPDAVGNYQYYDGYMVYYDGNGKYSYSFVTDTDNGKPRSFKITASEEFTKWPAIEKVEITYPIDLYIDPASMLNDVATYPSLFGVNEILTDENTGTRFIRFSGNDYQTPEGYFYAYKNGDQPTGQYFVMKYRIPEGNPDPINRFEIYTKTVGNDTSVADNGYGNTNPGVPDGQWYVLVIDIAARAKEGFAKNENGEYVVEYLRFDVFNSKVSKDTRFDVAYVGFCDDLNDVFKLEGEDTKLLYSEEKDVTVYLDKNGNKTEITK